MRNSRGIGATLAPLCRRVLRFVGFIATAVLAIILITFLAIVAIASIVLRNIFRVFPA